MNHQLMLLKAVTFQENGADKIVTMDSAVWAIFQRDRNRKETLASEMLATVIINGEGAAGISNTFGLSSADATKIDVKISKFK